MHTINLGEGPNAVQVYTHYSVVVTRGYPRRIDVNVSFDILHTGNSQAYIDAPVRISYPVCCWVQVDFSFTTQASGWNDARVYAPIFVWMEGPQLSFNNVVFVNTTNVVDEEDLDEID